MLAAIRPAGQDLPVLLHIVGATIAFGALLASASCIALARGRAPMLRAGYFALLLVAVPGWALMWGAGEWIYHKQGWNDLPHALKDLTWLNIGFWVADVGGLVFILALVLGGVAIARLRRGDGGAGLLQATMVIALGLAVAYVVAVWAMTGKPGSPALASASPPPVVAGQTRVSVSATEFRFTLSKTTVPHGTVVFTVVNRGKISHDFWIDGKVTPLLSPGQSASLAVDLSAGTFKYICTVPGHAAAGMKGALTVT